MPDLEVHHPEDPRPRKVLAAALDRLRRDSTLQRRVLLRTIGIAVLVATLATVILTVMALTSSASTADRLAAAGDVLVGATLLLAVIAALVALLAYAVSTGTPDLQLSTGFYPSVRHASNNPAFVAEMRDRGVLNAHGSGMVYLRNDSGYSAKNPVVIVSLHGMLFVPSDRASFEREWASMGIAEVSSSFAGVSGLGEGLTVVQWDGGSTYSIHGHSTRRLPDLQFSNLWYIPGGGKPAITFEILAEGYRKEITLLVDFTVDGQSRFPREDGKTNPEWM